MLAHSPRRDSASRTSSGLRAPLDAPPLGRTRAAGSYLTRPADPEQTPVPNYPT